MKTQIKTWMTALLLLPILLLAESKTGYVNGTQTTASVSFSSAYDTSYTISASPTDGWVFTDDFGISGYNGWYESGSHSASCEKIVAGEIEITTVWIDAATAFGVTINGKMYKPGGSGGSLIDWSVTGSGSGTCNTTIDPTTAIIALGDSKTFTYKINGANAPNGLWWDSSKTPSFDSGNYSASGGTYGFSSTTAGEYTLTVARNGAGDKSASATVKNVEVASVSAGTVSSTTDNPQANETLIVPKGNSSITIAATPNPTGAWPTGFPTWKIGDTSAGTAGSATLSFDPTTAGSYTISAFCGNSYKKAMKIVVVQITHNGDDVTEGSGTSKSMVVGARNNLVVSGASFSSVSWSIPGSHVKSWTITSSSSSIQSLTTSDLSSTTLTPFYWYKGATSLTPSVNVTIGSQETGFKSATINTKPFTVTKPSITVTAQTGSVALDENYLAMPGLYIHYGAPSFFGGTPGISFSHSSVDGLTQWVQLYTGTRRRQLSSNNTWERVEGPGLDNAYPYSNLASTEDAPAVSLSSALSQVIVNDSLQMYLMYKPIPDGIYVPIKVTSWGWSGSATRSGETWSLSGASKTTPSTSDASGYPIWDKVVNASNWVAE